MSRTRRTGRRVVQVLGGAIVAVILLAVGLAIAGVGSDPNSHTATKADAGGHSLGGSPQASIPGASAPPASPAATTYTPPPAAPVHHVPTRVHFYVTGTAPGGASIQYGSDSDERNVNGGMGSLGDATLVPFKARMRFDGGALYYSMNAQLEDQGGAITCKIVVTKAGYQPLTVATGHASGNYSICDVQAAPTDSTGTSWERE